MTVVTMNYSHTFLSLGTKWKIVIIFMLCVSSFTGMNPPSRTLDWPHSLSENGTEKSVSLP